MHGKIKIDYIAKIEGHASFLADIVRGEVEKAKIKVEEGARLIEGILRNREIEELPEIASRICGICPVVHYLTSLKAIEAALGVKISKQTLLLRKLMMAGQMLNSHSLHLFFFSCPDFLGLESDLELIKKCPVETSYSIKIRDIGNKIVEIIGGRAVHPLTPKVGGFRKLPEEHDLKELKNSCLEFLPQAEKLAQFFLKLDYPKFERETDYICLKNNKEYAVYEGKLDNLRPEKFIKKIKETQLPKSVVKRTLYKNGYMLGALARIYNNHYYLNPLAKKILLKSPIKKPEFNPFYNILAQAIEIIHFFEEIPKLIDEILKSGVEEEKLEFNLKEGKGVGAMEAPRGTLFYDVELTKEGKISNLNIITPTVQNLANLEKDLESFEKLEGWEKLNKKQRRQKIAMLIRAYDPCITCATH